MAGTATPWSCVRCTFENEPQVRECAICLYSRPMSFPKTFPAPVKPSESNKTKKSPQQQSLLVRVGSSVEKEEQRVQKKLQQLKELGIDLASEELLDLLAKNCYSVHVAACDYFERMAKTERQEAAGTNGSATSFQDEEEKKRLEVTMQKLERELEEDYQVLGIITMAASVNRSGVTLQVGEQVLLQAENAGKKRLRPGMSTSSGTSSGVVRIATMAHAQIGRLERDLEILLHPMMKSGLVTLGGACEVPPVSSRMFASFNLSVVVYVSAKAFEIFKEGHTNFHLSDALYSVLQMVNSQSTETSGAQTPHLASAVLDSVSSQVNPEDLDTLFSECIGANELDSMIHGSNKDPSEQLLSYLQAIQLRDHQKQALRWMLWREAQLKDGQRNANNPYEPWSRIAWWKRGITKPYEGGDDVNALGRLKVILTPVLLRRTKYSRDKDGNKIVQLPSKHVDLVKLDFSPDERAFYQAVYDKSQAEFNGFVASGSATSSYVAIFALLLRLRQACNHPLLALGKGFEQALKPSQKSIEAGATAIRSAFQPQENESSEAYYQRIAAQLQQDMQASNRTQLVKDSCLGEEDGSKSSGGGLTESYIQSVIAQVEDGLDSQECPICLDPPQKAVLTPCAHVLCEECLRETLSNDSENGCPVCRTVIDMDKVFALPPPSPSKAQGDKCPSTRSTDENLVEDKPAADDDGRNFESAKLQQLLRDLKAIKLENEHSESPDQKRKVVVFSQWTSMLDMVSLLLKRNGFSHCVFNGSLQQEARERVLTRFEKDPTVEVLVISLKAGGVGLNLTCASVVILLDPWWNPGVEEQAIDRVHRLGQTRDVLVKRYVVNDTVEDMILQLQQRKEKLAKHVLVTAKAHDERRSERLNLDDLRSFFHQ
ncbi:DNA helicase rad5 [Phytophthora boehmeriae]|uniref:RanBP-type and C3HC4-type zinc finger-containing protein 1 n=1 Tax=Phytophthora boehmeriae TaxID=109152 RepID=A0A8T1WML4_9STRA|nr:DNA helicase rad5 [Phytophthora boehmeriae]